MRPSSFICIAAAILACCCLPTATATYEGKYICRQALICNNANSLDESMSAGGSALEAVKWLVDRTTRDNIRVLPVKGCVTTDCCCKNPISVAIWTKYKNDEQLEYIDNWMQALRNGSYSDIFPKATCIVDNSNDFSATSPKCIQPDHDPSFPVVCREVLGCSNAIDPRKSIDEVNEIMYPWFQKWGYNQSDFERYFMATNLAKITVGNNCSCKFVVSVAMQIPVDPKNIVTNVAIDLDEYMANNLSTLDQFKSCRTKNNTEQYAESHRDSCDLPAPLVASPPPPVVPNSSPDNFRQDNPYCRLFLVCSNQPDWPWPAGQLESVVRPIFDSAGISTAAPNLHIKQLDGNIISFAGKTCTCSLVGEVRIAIPAVSFSQAWTLYNGLKDSMVAGQGVLTDFECVMDATKQMIADNRDQCDTRPFIRVSPPAPTGSPNPPGPFPFDCSLQVKICDNSIDYAWTDTKLRLTADACRAQSRVPNVRFTSGQLDHYSTCRCNFPGFMNIMFEGGSSSDEQKDSLVSCIVTNLRLNYKDTVCVEGEPSSKCYSWQKPVKPALVAGWTKG